MDFQHKEKHMSTPYIPSWFWQLLPLLCRRQPAAKFEQWLYTPEAEQTFPKNVYADLLWLDYRNSHVFKQVKTVVAQYISINKADEVINFVVGLFDRLGNVVDFYDYIHMIDTWHLSDIFPLPATYLAEMEDYLYHHYWLWTEESDDVLTERQKELNAYLDKLYHSLLTHTAPPPIP